MRPERFQELCLTALTGSDIKAVDVWSEEGTRPFGLEVTFAGGSRVWLGITASLAPGEKHGEAEVPVTGPRLSEVSLPALYENQQITPQRAERYLAGAIGNMGHEEIARVWAYTDREVPRSQPGVGVEFHSGARIFLLLVHTARPEQQRGNTAYRLQEHF